MIFINFNENIYFVVLLPYTVFLENNQMARVTMTVIEAHHAKTS